MVALLVSFVVIIILYGWFFRTPKNYPPGPLCLPFVGSGPFIQSKNFHFYLDKITKKYGPVIGYKFGPVYTVTVSGLKQAKEVFMREEFQGRPLYIFPSGIMFNEGHDWSVQRRFTIGHLREFGFGKKSIETVVLQEAEEFFENVLQKNEIIQATGLFTPSIVNVVWAMIAGKRFSYGDNELKLLLHWVHQRFRSTNVTGGFLATLPFLRKLFPKSKWFKIRTESDQILFDFFRKVINSHKKSKTENTRDFIDIYLNELKKTDRQSSFSEDTLINICGDLFMASAESVGNTLSFCLLYCVLYPEWQEKMHEEIENYDTSTPYLDNKGRLSKVEAFLNEVMRCNTIAPLGVFHKTLKDTELNGYFLPKNTNVLISIWSILQDKEHWKDPENFRPERFLNEDGIFKRERDWLPFFGLGRRVCPGETVARNFMLLYLTCLIRNFKFSIPEGHPKPSTVCLPGFTNAPQPFQIKITKRF